MTQKRSKCFNPLEETIAISDKAIVTYEDDTNAEPTAPTASQPFPDLNLSRPLPIIVRATNGKSKQKTEKTKLSTLVEIDTLESFFARYAEICKAGMSGMKKRDRSKQKEKLKAKKKKQGGTGVVTDAKKL